MTSPEGGVAQKKSQNSGKGPSQAIVRAALSALKAKLDDEDASKQQKGVSMRLPAFLCALWMVAMVAFGTTLSSQQTSNVPPSNTMRPAPGPTDIWSGYNSSRMWRRAQIRVVPLDEVDLNKAELQSFEERVARAEAESTGFWLSDPVLRKQLSEQLQLMKELLKFAQKQQSSRVKSPTAIEVERRLNQIQGQTMCEACHSGIVARNGGVR